MNTVLAIRHVDIEHAGFLGDILYNIGYNLHYLDTPNNQLLNAPIENYSLLIVLGGYMGAYEIDKYPFLKYELDIIEHALKINMPILGICLGSQLLAKVLGANVYKANQKEIGFFEIQKVCDNKYFEDFPNKFTAFQWHNDTFDLPHNAVRVFSSDIFKNQGFVYNKAVGLQFHIEVDESMISRWLIEYGDEIRKEGLNPQDILISAKSKVTELKKYIKNFINKLLKY